MNCSPQLGHRHRLNRHCGHLPTISSFGSLTSLRRWKVVPLIISLLRYIVFIMPCVVCEPCRVLHLLVQRPLPSFYLAKAVRRNNPLLQNSARWSLCYRLCGELRSNRAQSYELTCRILRHSRANRKLRGVEAIDITVPRCLPHRSSASRVAVAKQWYRHQQLPFSGNAMPVTLVETHCFPVDGWLRCSDRDFREGDLIASYFA